MPFEWFCKTRREPHCWLSPNLILLQTFMILRLPAYIFKSMDILLLGYILFEWYHKGEKRLRRERKLWKFWMSLLHIFERRILCLTVDCKHTYIMRKFYLQCIYLWIFVWGGACLMKHYYLWPFSHKWFVIIKNDRLLA